MTLTVPALTGTAQWDGVEALVGTIAPTGGTPPYVIVAAGAGWLAYVATDAPAPSAAGAGVVRVAGALTAAFAAPTPGGAGDVSISAALSAAMQATFGSSAAGAAAVEAVLAGASSAPVAALAAQAAAQAALDAQMPAGFTAGATEGVAVARPARALALAWTRPELPLGAPRPALPMQMTG